MDQNSFIEKYKSEIEMYRNWGNYVEKLIKDDIVANNKLDIEKFFQMPTNPRVKEIDSIINKAFIRVDKKYKNPYDEIEDKVGIRFVVLYKDDIKIIENSIESLDIWHISKDQDFEEQRDKNPEHFGYESVHYILRNKEEINIDGIKVKINTPCEIQIRTLLQHAYCQVSHHTMYKKKSTSKAKRTLSRSMAIIESADIFFKEVKDVVNEEEKTYKYLIYDLTEYYENHLNLKCNKDHKFNDLIIDTFKDFLIENIYFEITKFFDENRFIIDIIRNNYNNSFIYRQSTVLLIYFLINEDADSVENLWPITYNELECLFTDLGYSLN